MREPLARLWAYGSGRLELRLTAAHRLTASFAVDGRMQRLVGAGRPVRISLALRGQRWHLVEVRVSHMVRTPKRPEMSSRREGVRVLVLGGPLVRSGSRR
jgi:hypothetical protein